MTDTEEFFQKGMNASFFDRIFQDVRKEVETQYREYAKNAKPHFSNVPYWQMSTDVPVTEMRKEIEDIEEWLYEEDEDNSAEEFLQEIRSYKRRFKGLIIQALLAYVCVGSDEGRLEKIVESEKTEQETRDEEH